MYCLLKSQLDGKPFLVTAINNEADIERIEDFVRDMWLSAELFLEAYSGSNIDFLPEDFTKIINGDYSSKAYKERWRDIESRYRCKDWYLGMIAQVEAEEALKGRSEI